MKIVYRLLTFLMIWAFGVIFTEHYIQSVPWVMLAGVFFAGLANFTNEIINPIGDEK